MLRILLLLFSTLVFLQAGKWSYTLPKKTGWNSLYIDTALQLNASLTLDKNLLILGDTATLRLYDAKSRKLLRFYRLKKENRFALVPRSLADGHGLLIRDNRTLFLLNLRSGEATPFYSLGKKEATVWSGRYYAAEDAVYLLIGLMKGGSVLKKISLPGKKVESVARYTPKEYVNYFSIHHGEIFPYSMDKVYRYGTLLFEADRIVKVEGEYIYYLMEKSENRYTLKRYDLQKGKREEIVTLSMAGMNIDLTPSPEGLLILVDSDTVYRCNGTKSEKYLRLPRASLMDMDRRGSRFSFLKNPLRNIGEGYAGMIDPDSLATIQSRQFIEGERIAALKARDGIVAWSSFRRPLSFCFPKENRVMKKDPFGHLSGIKGVYAVASNFQRFALNGRKGKRVYCINTERKKPKVSRFQRKYFDLKSPHFIGRALVALEPTPNSKYPSYVTLFDAQRGRIISRTPVYYRTINSACATADPKLRTFALGSNYTGKIYITSRHHPARGRHIDLPGWLHPEHMKIVNRRLRKNTHLTVTALRMSDRKLWAATNDGFIHQLDLKSRRWEKSFLPVDTGALLIADYSRGTIISTIPYPIIYRFRFAGENRALYTFDLSELPKKALP